jgi:iron complex outermembrane receptor protein
MPVPVAPGIEIPNVISLFGSRSFNSEDLLAYELGYRASLHSTLSLDIAGYYNDYDHLRSISIGDPSNPTVCEEGTLATLCNGGNLVTAFNATNFVNGRAYGVEVAADWSPTDFALVRAGYTYMDLDLSLNAGAVGDVLSLTTAGQSPHNQVFAHGFLDLPRNVDFDVVARWVDRLQSIDVDSYFTVDARLAWEPISGLEFAVVGQNLTDGSHLEFASSSLVSSQATEVQRGVYGMVTWRH